MLITQKRDYILGRWAVGLATLITILLIACGGGPTPTNTPTPTQSQQSDTPTSTSAATQEGPTATSRQSDATTPTSAQTQEGSATTSPATTSGQETGLKWGLVSISGQAPGVRKDATLVYDDASNSLLLFGGRQSGAGLNDLWAFDIEEGQWREMEADGAPDPRWGHVAIFDSSRRQMVVFSGQRSGGFFNDTWVFDTASREWAEVTPGGDIPAPRYGSCLGYDSEGDLFYISHGFTNSGRFDDTWTFNLESRRWTDVSPDGDRPVERCLHKCVFSPGSGSLLLFGGQSNQAPPIRGDLWSYDLSKSTGGPGWTEIMPQGEMPLPRFDASLTIDPDSQMVLLFGGVASDGLRKSDLWAFTQGEGWAELGPSGDIPEGRSNHSGAFVPQTSSYYIFGGAGGAELNDLWVLRPG